MGATKPESIPARAPLPGPILCTRRDPPACCRASPAQRAARLRASGDGRCRTRPKASAGTSRSTVLHVARERGRRQTGRPWIQDVMPLTKKAVRPGPEGEGSGGAKTWEDPLARE